MISGVNSNYCYNTNTFPASTNSVSTTTDSKSEKEAQISQCTPKDTIEISPQARAAMEKAKAAAAIESKTSSQDTETQQSTTDLVQSSVSQTDSANENTASVATGTSTSSSIETSSAETTVLSSLTEQQMNDLVSDGTITSTQVKNELARRSAEKEATQAINTAQSNGMESYRQQMQSTTSTSTSGSVLNYVA